MDGWMGGLLGNKKRALGGALVLYTTKHGSTQRFAERIAQPLDALVRDAAYAKLDRAKTYDAIVLGCCVYMGKIKGLDFFADHAKDLADKRLVLFTCGLYDPAHEDVRENLDCQIEAALGDAAKHVSVFHLRGAIRWRSLGLAEGMMLKVMLSGIRRKREEERTLIERQLLEAEGGSIDFSDEADLAPIVHAARFGKGEA